MQALIDHLRARGAETVSTKSHTEVRFNGSRIGTIGRNDNANVLLAISDVKRAAPELLEGYNGPGVSGHVPKKRKDEQVTKTRRRKHKGGVAVIPKGEIEALRYRVVAVLPLFGTQHKLAEWVHDVKKEEFPDAKSPSTVSAAGQTISAITRGRNVTPVSAQVINRAIDLAFELNATQDTEVPAAEEPQVAAPRVVLKPESEPAVIVQEADIETGDVKLGIRQRYVDLLLSKAEQGDEQAMDRLEKLAGL